MDTNAALFFDRQPVAMPLYEAVEAAIADAIPSAKVKVKGKGKTLEALPPNHRKLFAKSLIKKLS